MAHSLSQMKAMLIQRLENQGIEKCMIPGLLRQMASVFFAQPHMTRAGANTRLDFLGWKDFDLDEHTYQLAMACFEAENINSLKSLPADWFTLNFSVSERP